MHGLYSSWRQDQGPHRWDARHDHLCGVLYHTDQGSTVMTRHGEKWRRYGNGYQPNVMIFKAIMRVLLTEGFVYPIHPPQKCAKLSGLDKMYLACQFLIGSL